MFKTQLNIALLLLVFVFSCKKENVDNESPVISINSPISYQVFNAMSSIPVQGTVSDNNAIVSIFISLRDANNIRVGGVVTLNPTVSSVTIAEQLLLDDLYLKSGIYTLKISASDGVNQTDKYIDVMINEFPKSRNGLFVFSNSGSTTQVVKLDNTLSSTNFSSVAGDFLSGNINSINQQLYSCGKSSGKLVAYNVASATIDWQVSNTASGLPYFTSITQHEQEVYVGYYNRDIKSFTKSGGQAFSAQAFVNSYADELFVHNNSLLISEQPEISGGITRLVTYYLTGFVKDNILLNEDVKAMFSFSANEVVLFTNAAGTGKILVYNIASNSTWQPFALNSGAITSATAISNGVYLVTQNGEVNLVNLNTFTKSTYLSTVNAQLIKYDAVTNEVIVAEGNTLTSYDYSTKTIKGNYIHTDSILAFDFWYNK
jgi:hypothetical protein